jgi:hypothetical protein
MFKLGVGSEMTGFTRKIIVYLNECLATDRMQIFHFKFTKQDSDRQMTPPTITPLASAQIQSWAIG